MEPEQLIGGLVVAVILLINLLRRLLGPRAETEERAEPEKALSPKASPTHRQPPSLPDRPAKRRVSVPVASRKPHAPQAPAVTRRGRAVKLREELRNRRTLRQAIVLMTLLGPCRGLEVEHLSQ